MTSIASKRIPLADAERIAEGLRQALALGCERIAVAGSIRRRKESVGDIELVAIPKMGSRPNLFGEPIEYNMLDDILARLAPDSLTRHPTKPANGARLKRFWLTQHEITVELWLCRPDNWGNILAIRTGDADWSHLMVTPRALGGLMPPDLQQAQGILTRYGLPVPCPTEEAYFEALGIPWLDPERRTAATARQIAARVAS